MADNLPPPRNFITIVSGLPRSGTSLVLQMLAAGGMPILTDGVRAADEDNPRGYYEWERVKRLARDSSWVPEAVGKAVKAIYWFLYDFPPQFSYRVIFLRRDLDEVLTSQTRMLQRRGTLDESQDDVRMKQLFEQELRDVSVWLAQQSAWSKLDVEYQNVVQSPLGQAERIAQFLGGKLDVQAMTGAVDPKLHRSHGADR